VGACSLQEISIANSEDVLQGPGSESSPDGYEGQVLKHITDTAMKTISDAAFALAIVSLLVAMWPTPRRCRFPRSKDNTLYQPATVARPTVTALENPSSPAKTDDG
jgi:hypothetical protein